MTPIEGALLLIGIFGVPVGLLGLSHRFRNLDRRPRGAFWGGFVGYGIGLVVWVASVLGPAVMWDPASARLAGVVLPLVGFPAVGVILGALVGRTPRRGPGAPGRKRRRGASKEVASALGALLVAGVSPLAGQPPEEVFVVRDIDGGVILAETVPGVAPGSYASSVAVLGSEGVLLVDTFHGPTAAEWFLDRIAERTDAPVRWVVNTHHHVDHVGGNAAVLERFPDAEILAHPTTMERLASGGAAALDAERVEPAPPTTAVPDFLRLDVGSRTVWIQPLDPAHTDGDVVVWIDGILVAGDVIEEGLLRVEGADVAGWARILSALARRGPALVIPSHGGLPETIDRAALLHLQRDVLNRVVAVARRLGPGVEVDPSGSAGEFVDLRARFAEWGVEADAFDAWVTRAVEAARR